MRKALRHLLVIIPAAVLITLAALGPSVLTGYNDAYLLEKVETEPAAGLAEGFRYSLTANERIYILSMALKDQIPPQTYYAALIRGQLAAPSPSFMYTENRRGPSPGELTYEQALDACNASLAELRGLGAIPECRFDPGSDAYDVQLYTAVDMSDPQRNISVWQISYAPGRPVSEYRGALLEAWLDAETGALYSFSLRTDNLPDTFDPGALTDAWRRAANLTNVELLIEDNSMPETTPHYQKYAVEGLDNERTVIIAGYYEGINEVFLRIT
jgi:hypothetical protein